MYESSRNIRLLQWKDRKDLIFDWYFSKYHIE